MELELRGTSKPGGASIRLSEADPELLGDAADRHPLADHDLRLHALRTGRWRPLGDPAPRLGYLIVDGLIRGASPSRASIAPSSSGRAS